MARSERRRLYVPALATFAAVLAACQVLVPLVADVEGQSPTEVGTPDAEIRDAGAVDPCIAVPPRVTGTSRTSQRIVLAAYRWRFDEADDTPPEDELCGTPGFDLDDADTRGDCRGRGSCTPLGGPGTCDLARGVDDSFANVLSQVRILSAKSLPDATTVIETGAAGAIFQLDDYNGEADDEDVSLTIFAAAALDGHVPDAGIGQVFSISTVNSLDRVWDGSVQDAQWLVDERSYSADDIGIMHPADTTRDAYVRDGILVAKLHQGTFPLGGTGAPNARYNSGLLAAKLSKGSDGRWRLLRGRVGVRCPSDALLNSLAAAHTPTSAKSGQLCATTNVDTYGGLRTAACGALDLPAEPAEADAAAKPSCGDISAGFTFAAIDTVVKQNPVDLGVYQTMRSVFGSSAACPDDDAGTVACDRCEWSRLGRCYLDGAVADAP